MSDRSERLKEVFEAALALTGEDRDGFLAECRRNDSALYLDVVALLNSDERVHERFLAGCPASGEAREPTRIGRYQITRRIGDGGMGTVFEAVQDNPRRSVALKLLKGHLFSPEMLRRFEYEAHVLASLRHQGIAQIYEAGTHEIAGISVPYFALELISDARTITEYANKMGLDSRARLELFVQVCEAVRHGHQRGIIHRDLKPSNILVDSAGMTHVIDFGVARSVTAGDPTTQATTVGQMVGTLAYMSPEQCGGDSRDLDLRTDVYSLGIILYQLLCDRLPYRVEQADVLDAVRAIREDRPSRPSHVHRILRGDIEVIVLKAIEKDRARRYQTVDDLSRDIIRFLANEPIEARRDSTLYVLRKMFKRHRAAFSSVVALMALIAGSVAALSILYARQGLLLRQVGEERDKAVSADMRSQDQLRKADYEAYLANIAAADGALTANDGGAAKRRLNQAPIVHRNWEWRFLSRAADSSESMFHGLANHHIRHVAFSPDGRYLGGLSHLAGQRSQLHIWDWRTGATVLSAPACDDRLTMFFVTPYRFTPDSSHVQVFPDAGTVISYELQHGKEDDRSNFVGATAGLSLLIAAPHGFVASKTVGGDLFVQILNQDHSALGEFRAAGPGYFNAVACSTDGSRFSLGDEDGMACVCKLDSNPNAHRFRAHTSSIHGMTFGLGGLLATSSEDGSIKVWSVNDGVASQPAGLTGPDLCVREVQSFRGSAQRVGGVAFSPDSGVLASASADKVLRLWNVASGELLQTRRGHSGALCDVVFHPDGRHLATGSYDGTIRVWDADRQPETTIRREMPGYVDSLAFHSDGSRLIAVTTGGTLDLDAADGRTIKELSGRENPDYSVFLADRTDAWIGDRNGGVRVVEPASGRELRRYAVWKTGPVRLVFNSSKNRVACVIHSGGAVAILDASTGMLLGKIKHPQGAARTIDFSPVDGWLATGSTAGELCLWDTVTRQQLWVVQEHSADISSVAFSPDGMRLVTGSTDGTINLHEARSGRLLAKISPQVGDIWCTAFSPDGTRLAVGGRDRTVRIFDAAQSRELLTLRGPTGTVMSLAWSPDGRRLAAGSWANEVFIWDAGLTIAPRLAEP